MTHDEIIFMARASGWLSEYESSTGFSAEAAITFAKLVEQHMRKTIDDEAKASLQELRKNFDAENAELQLHMWSQEKQA